MSLKDEIRAYDKVKVSCDTGEIETWDSVIFPNVIRKREIELILSRVEKVRPKRILDFGCGAGWLSKVLSSTGYNVVGIDASSSLIRTADNLSLELSHFVVGDCMNLPFKDNTFDLVVGMAVFHHLNARAAFAECWRVSADSATLMLMEPNKLNPIAALGRKITNVQTKDENPFYPWHLTDALSKAGWIIKDIRYLFPYSFGLSYLLKKLLGDRQVITSVCAPIEVSEKILEKIPYLNRFCSTIFEVAKKASLSRNENLATS